MKDLLFEWDEEKNKRNIKKHKISFETARFVFADENRIEFFQNRNGEERYLTIGRVGEIIVVVYTMRNEIHRIISARFAEYNEREAYFGNC
ncbi:MAG: BrnT family toxin [Lachnospiraceae bacterium]|nr:BrnT family toxin [Lachnospiraceae bacterium]